MRFSLATPLLIVLIFAGTSSVFAQVPDGATESQSETEAENAEDLAEEPESAAEVLEAEVFEAEVLETDAEVLEAGVPDTTAAVPGTPRIQDGSQLGDDTAAGRGRTLAPTVPIFSAKFRAQPKGARVFLGPLLPKDDGYGSGAWQRRMEADEFSEICTAPCVAPVYPGNYRFALAPEFGGPVRARGVLRIEGDTVVMGEYRSHRARRIAGFVTMAASVIGGSVMTFAGVSGCDGSAGSCVRKSPLVWLGVGVFLLGVPTGLWLTLNDDQVSFSMRPSGGKN